MSHDGILLAHGVGGRDDLPIPFTAALSGAVVALLATFVVLGVAWRDSRFRGADAGRPLPGSLARILDSPGFRWTLRAFGLLAAGWLVVLLVFGARADSETAAPGVLYVLMWVWVPLASVLLGPVWRAVNPLRTIHRAIARADSKRPTEGLIRLPERWGFWPAAVTLSGFVWLELVPPDSADLPMVALALTVYAAVMLIGAALFGSTWFARADPFEVYSTLAARLAPVGRRSDGTLVLRNPFNGLDSIPNTPGLPVFVLVLLGSTAFDSISGSTGYLRLMLDTGSPILIGTAGLALVVSALSIAYFSTTRITVHVAHGRNQLPGLFAHSLLPIAIGYVIAHYYSLAVLEGPRTLIRAADSLGTGDNLLGIEPADVSFALVGPTTVATVQVAAVVAGHIAGAVAAHDRAVRLFPPRVARIGQLPLLLLMVGYTYVGLTLLFAA